MRQSATKPVSPKYSKRESDFQNEALTVTRFEALAHTPVDSLKTLDKSGVLVLQSILRHGADYGIWETPIQWHPLGALSVLRIDLRQRIISSLKPTYQSIVKEAEARHKTDSVSAEKFVAPSIELQILDEAVLAACRYLLLLRMGPSTMQAGITRPLKPSNIAGIAYMSLSRLLALGVSRRLDLIESNRGAVGFFKHIQISDIDALSDGKSSRKQLRIELERIHRLAEKGFWEDTPAIESVAPVSKVKGEPKAKVGPAGADEPHQPLPDDYVAEMGRKSLWLVKDLAPNLFAVGQEICQIWSRTDSLAKTADTVRQYRIRQVKAYLNTYIWRDSQGAIIEEPPFPIRLMGFKDNENDVPDSETDDAEIGLEIDWPPQRFANVMGLMHNVQLAHLFIVSLSTGARKSETLDLKRDCIRYAPDGLPYASGRTFKLVQHYEGEQREWVLPDLAVDALEQQVRLVQLIEAIGPMKPTRVRNTGKAIKPSNHLWCTASKGKRNSPLRHINPALLVFAQSLGMDTAPGGQNLRPHRLRKTLARLVALALTQAPKILKDVFGHKSIEMTLYYILTNEDLRVEIEEVARELRVMRAKEIIEKMVEAEGLEGAAPALGGFGGQAALMMERAIATEKQRLHRQSREWGADSAMDLANLLTLSGQAWEYVRPGIICTKLPATEFGPCRINKGRPEPSKCQSHCRHRLEEDFLRDDVDGAIRDSVEAYDACAATSDEMTQALWAGQVRAHLTRFEDLKMKWLIHPTVQKIIRETEGQLA